MALRPVLHSFRDSRGHLNVNLGFKPGVSEIFWVFMQRSVFSIASMLVLVLITGVGLAALRVGSFPAMKWLYVATVIGLLTAVIAARVRRRGAGAFWLGCAVFGWGYFLLALTPWMEFKIQERDGESFHFGPRKNPLLPTQGVVEWVAATLAEPSKPQVSAETRRETRQRTGRAYESDAEKRAYRRHAEREANTVVIGHLLLVWACSVLGGVFVLALSRPRRKGRKG